MKPARMNLSVSTQPLSDKSHELPVVRLKKHVAKHYEIKDPSVVQVADDKFLMYASIGNSLNQEWLVGRFEADNPRGPWTEIEPVNFVNIKGPQLCAPAVTVDRQSGQQTYHMYIQTACFEENGVIMRASSTDGQTFLGDTKPLISKDSVVQGPVPVVGVYDVGVSSIRQGQEELLCMLYSGYRRVGCGDLFMSTKTNQGEWVGGNCILPQEQVPFHNHPDSEFFEWGLEGAKLVQLADDCFMLIGVCFVPLPHTYAGKRQRVFIAIARSINGPFTPIGTPFEPISVSGKSGENGHPDTLIIGDTMWIFYQERLGTNEPWHLRLTSYKIPALLETFQSMLGRSN
jgi:hypothetical protein